MRPKLSVIVPAYNVEAYIGECLNSLVNQTLKNIEIIIVNDGSTDSTLDIILNYKKKYKNIILINQKNQGVSFARNSGLDKAKGEYITFVDADDWLELDTYEYVYEIAKEKLCDVVQFNYSQVSKDKFNCYNPNLLDNVVFEHEEIKKNIKEKIIRGSLPTYVWDKIYKLDFLKNNNILFENIPRYEDWYFNCKVISKVERYIFINRCFYNYRFLNNSLSKKLYLNRDLLLIQLHTQKRVYMKKWKMYNESYIKDFHISFFYDVSNYITGLFMNSNSIGLKQRYQKIRNLVHSNLVTDLKLRNLIKDIEGNKFYNIVILVCLKYKLSIPLWIIFELYFKFIY